MTGAARSVGRQVLHARSMSPHLCPEPKLDRPSVARTFLGGRHSTASGRGRSMRHVSIDDEMSRGLGAKYYRPVALIMAHLEETF